MTRPAGLDDFLDRIAAIAYAARNGGAAFLVLPEYAAMVLAGAFIGQPDIAAELAVVADHAERLMAGMQNIARDAGLWLLGGSLPMRRDGVMVNRAPLFSPSGACAMQDKQRVTRFEAEQCGMAGGGAPNVFATEFGLIGISICYDAEFPMHVRAQVKAGAMLILVPSCTGTIAGFNRVRLAARARAIENQCFVAMVPMVGAAPWSGSIDDNHGYAGVFGPADIGFPDNGVLARGSFNEPGLIFAEIDTGRIGQVRLNGRVRNHRDWQDDRHTPPCPVIKLA